MPIIDKLTIYSMWLTPIRFLCLVTLLISSMLNSASAQQIKINSSKDQQGIEGAVLYNVDSHVAYKTDRYGIATIKAPFSTLQIKAKYHQPLIINSDQLIESSITLHHDKRLLADEQALVHPTENVQWGSYHQYRENNDLLSYDLTLKVDIDKRHLQGNNKIRFKMLHADDKIRIDLYQNLTIDKIVFQGKPLSYQRDLNAVYIQLPQKMLVGSINEIDFHYSGQPSSKGRFGCFTFQKDNLGIDWVNTACQGTGSMVWWPNKDQQRDEVESMTMRIAVPSHLKNISNGSLVATNILADGYTEYVWQINNPINNYSISLNIGNYVHFGEKLGELQLDYYVLKQDLDKAKRQFTQVVPMMKSYQKYFGAYPFIEDGYKLIQAPYTGMEHQSAITYGNQFKNGYNRGDGSDGDWTGVGISLLFDFIIIHESGHEWFGNSLTSNDFSDAWIHEAWCTYAEAVYVEDQFGYDKAIRYINGYKHKVENRYPMIGPPSVGHWPTSDIYFKGILFINTLRHIVDNDQKWWAGVKAYTHTFKKKTSIPLMY